LGVVNSELEATSAASDLRERVPQFLEPILQSLLASTLYPGFLPRQPPTAVERKSRSTVIQAFFATQRSH